MKLITLFALIASTAISFGLNIPSGVYSVDELEEAKAKAAEKEKPLCLVYTSSALKPS